MLNDFIKTITVILILSLSPVALYAQNINQDLLQRLERLEKDSKLLSKKIFQKNDKKEIAEVPELEGYDLTGNIMTDFELRLSKVEKNMSILYGKFESLDYAIGVLNKSYNIFTDDTEYRLREIEKSLNVEIAQQNITQNNTSELPPNTLGVITQGKSDPKPVSVKKEKSPEDVYDAGFAKIRAGQYQEAQEVMIGFLASYPEHKLAGNVEYWLGETYYVMGDFKNAIMHFGDAYRKYPKNTKSDESLLKLAMSLSKVGRKKEACLALDQLVNGLENVPQSVKKQADSEMIKNQCTP